MTQYTNAELLTDVNGNPIPQYYDPDTNSFKAMEKVSDVQLTGSLIEEQSLHNATATDSTGDIFFVQGKGTVIISVTGVFYANLYFEGRNQQGVSFRPISAINMQNGRFADRAIRAGLYAINTNGLHSIRVRVADYFSGTINAYASTVQQQIELPKDTNEKFEWEFTAQDSSTTQNSGYWDQNQPYTNIKVVESQGLIDLRLQEEKEIGQEPVDVKRFYANNETFKIDTRGRKKLRLNARLAYRGADGVTLDPVKIVAWGSEQ